MTAKILKTCGVIGISILCLVAIDSFFDVLIISPKDIIPSLNIFFGLVFGIFATLLIVSVWKS